MAVYGPTTDCCFGVVCSRSPVCCLELLNPCTDNSRWSFGGNRLQIKAEVTVLTDVQLNLEALGKMASAIDSASKQVKAKQDLLSLLIASEQTRLTVWLYPLENGKKHHFTSGHAKGGLPDVSNTPRVYTTVLTLIDCCHCSLEDGLGGESCDRCTSCQALPVSTPNK
jgi:hypothetical protein